MSVEKRMIELPPAEQVLSAIDALVEIVAAGVLEAVGVALGEHGSSEPELLTAQELAKALKLTPRYVYDHADELGALRLGSGTRSPLRFDLADAKERLGRSRETAAGPPTLQLRSPRSGAQASRLSERLGVSLETPE